MADNADIGVLIESIIGTMESEAAPTEVPIINGSGHAQEPAHIFYDDSGFFETIKDGGLPQSLLDDVEGHYQDAKIAGIIENISSKFEHDPNAVLDFIGKTLGTGVSFVSTLIGPQWSSGKGIEESISNTPREDVQSELHSFVVRQRSSMEAGGASEYDANAAIMKDLGRIDDDLNSVVFNNPSKADDGLTRSEVAEIAKGQSDLGFSWKM